MLIHTRILSVQFNKKALFFKGSFPFYITKISNIDLDTNVKIRKFLFGENAFVDLFAVSLLKVLLQTCLGHCLKLAVQFEKVKFPTNKESYPNIPSKQTVSIQQVCIKHL